MNTELETAARTALRCLDLTSLNDGDTPEQVARLCARAMGPFGPVAAVCVWPRFAALARAALPASIGVAAVANFPSGDGGLDSVLAEVRQIVDAGAQEVDVVLPWRALRSGDEATAARLLRAVRDACTGLTLKVILETGELASDALIERAARLALDHGADFLKTSTGRSSVGATPQAAALLLRAIGEDSRIGLKLSGGIRRVADVLPYLTMVQAAWGEGACQPQRLRFGASSLLDDIEAVLGGSAAPPATTGY
jgi:deoxyribose-phosphate aldolase